MGFMATLCPDTDTYCGRLQDGLEVAGWRVEGYFERTPNIRYSPDHVWSDPHRSDTVGDGIGDADENKYDSVVDGIDASARKLDGGLDLARDYEWDRIEIFTISYTRRNSTYRLFHPIGHFTENGFRPG